jgi:hypothetical protein
MRPRRLAVVAALPLVTATLLAAYAFGEDGYRRNGVSRRDAYRSPGGALGAMLVASPRSSRRPRPGSPSRRAESGGCSESRR